MACVFVHGGSGSWKNCEDLWNLAVENSPCEDEVYFSTKLQPRMVSWGGPITTTACFTADEVLEDTMWPRDQMEPTTETWTPPVIAHKLDPKLMISELCPATDLGDLMDNTRREIERVDYFQGFHVLCDMDLEVAQGLLRLQDELGPKSMVVFTSESRADSLWKTDSFLELWEASSVLVPLSSGPATVPALYDWMGPLRSQAIRLPELVSLLVQQPSLKLGALRTGVNQDVSALPTEPGYIFSDELVLGSSVEGFEADEMRSKFTSQHRIEVTSPLSQGLAHLAIDKENALGYLNKMLSSVPRAQGDDRVLLADLIDDFMVQIY